jgi:hypothetical protein
MSGCPEQLFNGHTDIIIPRHYSQQYNNTRRWTKEETKQQQINKKERKSQRCDRSEDKILLNEGRRKSILAIEAGDERRRETWS